MPKKRRRCLACHSLLVRTEGTYCSGCLLPEYDEYEDEEDDREDLVDEFERLMGGDRDDDT